MNLLGAVGAIVDGIIVHRAMDGMPRFKGAEIFDQQRSIERIGVIVIEQLAFFERQLIVALVVAIMMQNADISAKILLQFFGHSGFAAAGTACYADHHCIHIHSPLPPVFFIFSYFGSSRNGRGRTFCAKQQKALDGWGRI